MMVPVLALLFLTQHVFWRLAERRVLLGAAALALLLSPAPAAAQSRISFMVFGDAAEKAAYERLVAEFARRTPQAQVTLVHIPGQGDYRKRLGIDFAAGTPADVILLNYRRYAAFAAKGVLEPLGPYLARSARASRRPTSTRRRSSRSAGRARSRASRRTSRAWSSTTTRTCSTRAGVPRPSDDWTWDDFLAAARALTRDTTGGGPRPQHGLGTEVSIFRLAPFIWQNGGELVDNPLAPHRLTLDTPRGARGPPVVRRSAGEASRGAGRGRGEGREQREPLPERPARRCSSTAGAACRPTGRSRASTGTWRRCRGIASVRASSTPTPTACRRRAGTRRRRGPSSSSPTRPRASARSPASGRTVPSLRAVAESPAFLDPGAKPRNSQVFLREIPHIRAVPVTRSGSTSRSSRARSWRAPTTGVRAWTR